MNHTYRIIPVYTGDVSGVCSALYELGGMVVIHDPSGCNSTYNTHDETRWYDRDSMIYISGLAERDAILGNDEKFLRDVTAAAEQLAPSFIALTNSPIPFMNGTDFEALARIIEKRTGIPTFYVCANGMHDYTVGVGNAFAKLADYMCPVKHGTVAGEPFSEENGSNDAETDTVRKMPAELRMEEEGHELVGEEEAKPAAGKQIRVNILGLTPLDFDAPDSVEIIWETLTANGFLLHVSLGMCAEGTGRRIPSGDRRQTAPGLNREAVCRGDRRAEQELDWQNAPEADVNLVVSSAGYALARKMEQQYGIPYVVGTPVGAFVEPLMKELEVAAERGTSAVAYSAPVDVSTAQVNSNRREDCASNNYEIILIGEAVTMESLAAAIRMQLGIPTRVICPLETWQGLLRTGSHHVEGEEELEQLLPRLVQTMAVFLQTQQEAPGQTAASERAIRGGMAIVADPLYRPILPPEARFIPLSHEAFSGRCFRRERKCLVGVHAKAVEWIAQQLEKE